MVFLYKNKKPIINEIVSVRIIEINKLNIVATLNDYDNLTGYISYSELARKKRYNLHKIVNVGKDIIVQVTGFNDKKHFAELSVRALIPSDISTFTSRHRKYSNLYNLWRYVYMKLTPDSNMDISKIIPLEINTFMEKTFWKIEQTLEDNFDEDDDENDENDGNEGNEDNKSAIVDNEGNINLDEEYNFLINPLKNNSLLKYIVDLDIGIIKNILNDYANIKIISVKQSKFMEFNICSWECDGLENIKSALNYKSYDKWDELSDKYEIAILYLTGGKYSLSIKEKTPLKENIDGVYDLLIQQIKANCELRNIMFSI